MCPHGIYVLKTSVARCNVEGEQYSVDVTSITDYYVYCLLATLSGKVTAVGHVCPFIT